MDSVNYESHFREINHLKASELRLLFLYLSFHLSFPFHLFYGYSLHMLRRDINIKLWTDIYFLPHKKVIFSTILSFYLFIYFLPTLLLLYIFFLCLVCLFFFFCFWCIYYLNRSSRAFIALFFFFYTNKDLELDCKKKTSLVIFSCLLS